MPIKLPSPGEIAAGSPFGQKKPESSLSDFKALQPKRKSSLADFQALQQQPQQPQNQGSVLGDIGHGLAAGTTNLAGAVGDIPNLLTAGAVPAVSPSLSKFAEAQRAQYRPETQQAMQNIQQAEGFGGTLSAIAQNPVGAAQYVVESAPSFVPGLGAVTGASRLARGAALAKGATQQAAQQAAISAGTKAAVGTNATLSGAFAGQQAAQGVREMPQEQLEALPDYQAMIAQGMAPEAAREALANRAGRYAGAVGAPLGAATGMIGAPIEARLAAGQAATLGGIASRIGATAGSQTLEEGLQEGAEQFAANIGQRRINPEQSLTEGVPESVALGGTLGAVAGGGLSGVSEIARLRQPQDDTANTADAAGNTADAVTPPLGLPSPGRHRMDRAGSVVMPDGSVSNNPADVEAFVADFVQNVAPDAQEATAVDLRNAIYSGFFKKNGIDKFIERGQKTRRATYLNQPERPPIQSTGPSRAVEPVLEGEVLPNNRQRLRDIFDVLDSFEERIVDKAPEQLTQQAKALTSRATKLLAQESLSDNQRKRAEQDIARALLIHEDLQARGQDAPLALPTPEEAAAKGVDLAAIERAVFARRNPDGQRRLESPDRIAESAEPSPVQPDGQPTVAVGDADNNLATVPNQPAHQRASGDARESDGGDVGAGQAGQLAQFDADVKELQETGSQTRFRKKYGADVNRIVSRKMQDGEAINFSDVMSEAESAKKEREKRRDDYFSPENQAKLDAEEKAKAEAAFAEEERINAELYERAKSHFDALKDGDTFGLPGGEGTFTASKKGDSLVITRSDGKVMGGIRNGKMDAGLRDFALGFAEGDYRVTSTKAESAPTKEWGKRTDAESYGRRRFGDLNEPYHIRQNENGTFSAVPGEQQEQANGVQEEVPVDKRTNPEFRQTVESLPKKQREAAIKATRKFKPTSQQAHEAFRDRLMKGGITDEALANELADEYIHRGRDSLTKWSGREDRMKDVENLIQHTNETGEPAYYIEADLRNLGGLNAHAGHTGADRHFKAIADIFHNAIKGLGSTATPYRHGGDEISATIAGGVTLDEVNEALANARKQVDDYVKENGLDAIPHTKLGRKPGVGLYAAAGEIRADDSVESALSRADRAVEQQKKGEGDVESEETTAAGRATGDNEKSAEAGGVAERGGREGQAEGSRGQGKKGGTKGEPEQRHETGVAPEVAKPDEQAQNTPTKQQDTDDDTARSESDQARVSRVPAKGKDGRRDSTQSGDTGLAGQPVATEQSEDVSETRGATDNKDVRDDSAGADVGDEAAVHGAGDAPARRPKSGRKGASSTDAGERGERGSDGAAEPESVADEEVIQKTRPNYHISDPSSLLGGAPKQRFAANRKAIETFQELKESGKEPTKKQLDAIAAYTGWGSFGQELFQGTYDAPRPKSGWTSESDWLRQTLGKKAWESAQRSIINAHYTDPPVVMAMWDMVKKMGFKSGRVLEPSMGIGNFFGMMPKPMKKNSSLTGIELDQTTGEMAQLLYPDAGIHIKGYQDSKTADNFYDLVIGNWPFAKDGPFDRRYSNISPSLHDYFFLKALDQVRPGGIVIGITSAGTLDKQGTTTRRELAKKGELVAAFRLPSGAFEGYAGTSVVTDIIVFQKRAEPIADVSNENWIETTKTDTPAGEPIKVNQYYIDNPSHVLGTLNWGHGSTYGRPSMIVDRPADLEARVAELPKKLKKIYDPETRIKSETYLVNHTDVRQGSVIKQKGDFYIVEGEHLIKATDRVKYVIKDKKKTADRKAQIEDAIGLRELYGKLINAEQKNTDDVEVKRKALKDAYTAYVEKYGPLRQSFGLAYIGKAGDPSADTLHALETDDGKPATLLSRSTTRKQANIENPSVQDAFVLARNEGVAVDLDRIAKLVNKPKESIARELIDSGAIFLTPTGDYEVSDQYLSGNVRAKLREAKAAKEDGMPMDNNIAALEKIIPADVPYYNIEAKLGANWISGEDYAEFAAHLIGDNNTDGITVTQRMGTWHVTLSDERKGAAKRGSKFAHNDRSFGQILANAINNTTTTVRYTDSDGKSHVDEEATRAVNQMISDIRESFNDWVWTDPERRVRLEANYNEVMNAYATPEYDGSFLSFSGMALMRGESPFALRKHQVNAIWRGLVNRRGLYAHEVGTGKSYTIAGIALESRRFGIARKPLILAHNANSHSLAKDINEMYPNAKVLYLPSLPPKEIKRKLNQIRTDDWDAIVMPHSQISNLTLTKETLMSLAADDIAALEQEAIEAAADDGIELTTEMMDNILDGDAKTSGKLRSATAKQLVHARNKIIEQINKQAAKSSKEGAINFEDLGIDQILVDEAHEFKKPPIATKMKMRGFSTAASGRSMALNFLTQYIKNQNNGAGVHLFTGTPITNTLTEAYHHMRYVMSDVMKRNGIDSWDSWFATFADSTNDIELTAAGEYEPVTRLASFVNVPELRAMLGQYMDTVFADDMPEFTPRKTVSGKTMSDDLTPAEKDELLNGKTEKPQGRPYKKIVNVTAPMTDVQRKALEEMVANAQVFRNATGRERFEMMRAGHPGSPVIVETSAANIGLDPRLALNTSDDPNYKVNIAADNIADIYEKAKKDGHIAAQVVFMERGDGKDGKFPLVKDFIDKLVKRGFSRDEIAWVHGGTSKEKRSEIAKKVSDGDIKVVIGKTSTLGVGVNMQTNLRAMHHMDAPWMPGELEQRNGRGHRQGNTWNTVLEYRYLTERMDGRRWQVLAVKDKFIKAFLKSKGVERVIEGDSVSEASADSADDIAETLSDAAGDPRLLIMNKLKSDVEKLQRRERTHGQGIAETKRRIRSLKQAITERDKRMPEHEEMVELAKGFDPGKPSITIYSPSGKSHKVTTEKKFNKDFKEAAAAHIAKSKEQAVTAKIADVSDGISAWVKQDSFGVQYFVKFDKSGYRTQFKGGLGSLTTAIYRPAEILEGELARQSDDRAAIASLEQSADEKFSRADELATKAKRLDAIEKDIQLNPVPAPTWLRSGAPVDTDVFVAGEKGTVTGHQWTENGYFVLVNDKPIDYLSVKDEQGVSLFEEREFEAPKVVDKKAKKSDDDTTKYSRAPNEGITAAAVRDALNLSPQAKQRLLNSQRVRIVQSVSDIPGTHPDDVAGAYHDGVIWLVADNLTPQDAYAVLLHEVVHAELAKLPEFKKILADVEAGIKRGGRPFVEARNTVPRGTPAEHVTEETLAYLVQNNPRLPVVRRLIAAIRAALRKLGLVENYTADDMVRLAHVALKRMAGGNPTTRLGDALYNRADRTSFQGRDTDTLPQAAQQAMAALNRVWTGDRLESVAKAKRELRGNRDAIDWLETNQADVAPNTLYSRRANTPDDAESLLREFDSAYKAAPRLQDSAYKSWDSVKNMARNKRRAWLGLLTRQQIADVGKDVQPQAELFERLARQKDADENQLVQEHADILKTWSKRISRFTGRKDNAQMALLARTMHEATIAGFDPDKDSASTPDEKRLARAWAALDASSKQLYRDVRDAYSKRRDELEMALAIRIAGLDPLDKTLPKTKAGLYERAFNKLVEDAQDGTAPNRRQTLAMLRASMESNRVKGPYFPLSRFGDYYITAEKAGEEKQFLMTESPAEWRRMQKELKAEGWTVTAGKKIENLATEMGPGINFMQDVFNIVEGSDASIDEATMKAMKDDLWQMYLRTLPDQSIRKHYIHRQNRRGFSQDAFRAFAHHTGHSSKQIARLRYSGALGDTLDAMKANIEGNSDPEKASDIADALNKSYQWMMAPNTARWAQRATSLGFAWYLGISPAAAAINLTQTPIVTFPVLSARYGTAKAGRELTRALKDYSANIRPGKWDTFLSRSGDLGRALKELEDSGAIDRTLTLSMLGMDSENVDLVKTQSGMMRTIGWFFHQAERANREITAIAAYRLARDAGRNHDQAVQAAYNAIYESHFDYSSGNRAQFMRGNTARILLLFRQFSQNMVYTLWRNAQQSLKGASPEARKEARKKLGGILGMTAVFSGVMGLPLMSSALWVAQAAHDMFSDDDDEEWDAELALRQQLSEWFGEAGGSAVARGALGAGIGSRTGLNDLILRSPDRDLEGKALAAYYLEQAAGPLAGIGINAFRGAELMSQGQLYRGIEAMTPKAVKDALRSARYWSEGVQSLRGDPIVARDDLSYWELFMQLNGLAPHEIIERYEQNNNLKRLEQKILSRRRSILNAYYMAWRDKDREGMREARQKMAGFNKAYPQARITPQSVSRSFKARERASRENQDGMFYNKSLRPLLQEQRYAA